MKCPKHPNAKIGHHKARSVCNECMRIRSTITGEFSRVKAFVRRMGWLEGLEK